MVLGSGLGLGNSAIPVHYAHQPCQCTPASLLQLPSRNRPRCPPRLPSASLKPLNGCDDFPPSLLLFFSNNLFYALFNMFSSHQLGPSHQLCPPIPCSPLINWAPRPPPAGRRLLRCRGLDPLSPSVTAPLAPHATCTTCAMRRSHCVSPTCLCCSGGKRRSECIRKVFCLSCYGMHVECCIWLCKIGFLLL